MVHDGTLIDSHNPDTTKDSAATFYSASCAPTAMSSWRAFLDEYATEWPKRIERHLVLHGVKNAEAVIRAGRVFRTSHRKDAKKDHGVLEYSAGVRRLRVGGDQTASNMATLFTKVTDPDALVFPAEEEIFLLQDAAEADTKALFRKLTDSPPPPFFLAAMDKPAGMRTDMSSGEAMREAVDRFLEDNGVGKNYLEWMPHPVGQLDLYTTGLLLFTNCGDLGHLLCLPDHVSKTYLVTLVVKKRAVENFVSEDDHEAGCSHDCINACENERVAFISESSFFTAGQLEALTVPRNKRRENKVFGAGPGGETETFTRETELDSVCFDSVEVILDGEHAPKEVLPGGKDHQGFMASYRRTAWDKKYEVKLLVKIRCGKNHVVKRLFQQRLGVPVRYLRRVAIDGLTVDEVFRPVNKTDLWESQLRDSEPQQANREDEMRVGLDAAADGAGEGGAGEAHHNLGLNRRARTYKRNEPTSASTQEARLAVLNEAQCDKLWRSCGGAEKLRAMKIEFLRDRYSDGLRMLNEKEDGADCGENESRVLLQHENKRLGHFLVSRSTTDR